MVLWLKHPTEAINNYIENGLFTMDASIQFVVLDFALMCNSQDELSLLVAM